MGKPDSASTLYEDMKNILKVEEQPKEKDLANSMWVFFMEKLDLLYTVLHASFIITTDGLE